MLRVSNVMKAGVASLAKRQMRVAMTRQFSVVAASQTTPQWTSRPVQIPSRFAVRAMSSYPEHTVVPMPALSPTMETGSIVAWNIKEGEKFEAGDSICEVETDKATVAYEATDSGYLAKIIVQSGEVKVGQPIMVTVEEDDEIAAFSSYSAPAGGAAPAPAAAPAAKVETPAAPSAPAASAPVAASSTGRVVASPYAKKLASEAGISINAVGEGSGPNGRIIADDVNKAITRGDTAAPVAASHAQTAPASSAPVGAVATAGSDFALSPVALAMGGLFATSKKTVPHYHLSVELNLSKVKKLCDEVNTRKGTVTPVTPQNVVFKAAALAMRKVPVANATFMDSFVRCYDKVDINVFTGSGDSLSAPLLRDAASLGVTDIATQTAQFTDAAQDGISTGTFSIHDLSSYGVKSAAAIVLPPQATALALGSMRDTVIPRQKPAEGEEIWEIAPMMTATLACDHRVVDGAVGAEWLSVFKGYVEDPLSMIL